MTTTAPPAAHDELLDPFLAPHWETSALLVIDTQVDFAEGGSTPVAGTREVVPALTSLVEAYRRAGLPVVHVVRLYDGDDVDLVRRRAIGDGAAVVRPGTPGSAILPELVPAGAPPLDPDVLLAGRPQDLGPGEIVVWKPRWSAFHRTPLEGLLRERGVDTVVVAGCNFPNCPRATLTDASERDLRAVVVPDAVSGTTEEGLAQVVGMGVVLRPSSAVVAAVAGAVARCDTSGTNRERSGTSTLGTPR
ncbi:cysteine hydrolase family protein [Cellulosimicrobium sp. CpK407]|uniref:cysteine hydrolase family protein n=1 Tax=Cellulosimicrobium sp. CpK407 TaxID=3229847 RepID=UPI003F3737FF